MRKNLLLVALLICFSTISLSAQNTIDFNETLDSLYLKHANGLSVEPGTQMVLDGKVEVINVIDYTPESFYAELTIMKAQWIGTDRVDTYRIYLALEGPAYAELFPKRVPRNPDPAMIFAGDSILTLCTYLGATEDNTPVVLGTAIRKF